MKIFNIKISLLVVGLLLLSCDKDDPIINLDGEPGKVTQTDISINPNEVSFFDKNIVSYNLFSSIAIVDRISLIGDLFTEDVDVTNKKGTFEADFSKLGISMIGDEVEIDVKPFISLDSLEREKIKISIVNPIELTVPENIVVTTSEADTLNYKINSLQVTDAMIKLEQKTFSDGSFTEILGDWDSQEDMYIFNAKDFSKLDTIFFKITATKDELVASNTIKVIIETEFLGESKELTLKDDNTFYSLLTASGVLAADSEIEFIPNTDPNNLGIKVTDPDKFKLVAYPSSSTGDVFGFGDKLETIDVVNSEPSLNLVSSLSAGDLFAYKSTRMIDGENVDFYGLLKVNTIVNDSAENTVVMSFKEGK